ncbi:MAG: hypothetical protein RPT94_06885 [Candidatus Sedimenticola sp. (ex Thyasira tokunagai)]
MSTSNCVPGKPLMDLGKGEAPTLDYDIPQRSCFSSLGRILLDIPEDWFLDDWKKEPSDHWWKIPIGNVGSVREMLDKEYLSPTNALFDKLTVSAINQPSRNTTVKYTRSRRNGPAMVRDDAHTAIQKDQVAQLVADGFRPFPRVTLGGEKSLGFIPKPAKPRPRLYLVEEYKACSYLADYGAGKTLNTFSLLPGEKTKITIRTYRDSAETRTASENILDSFSQESADELESLVQSESGTSSSSSSSQSNTTTGDAGLGVGIDLFGIVGVDVGGGIESSGTKSAETTQEEYCDVLSSALSKHVEQTAYGRDIEINTTTSETVTEGEEQTTVREISNINHSRVLNFVFRQLLQEYITIFYLNNVKVAFSTGYPESIESMELYSLDEILPKYIKEEYLDAAKEKILLPYCSVFNYKQEPKQFIEFVELESAGCLAGAAGQTRTRSFYRKNADLKDEVEGIEIHGVIKRVQRNVLRTPTVIIEALLGQGEALDCYNQELQASTVERVKVENMIQRQGFEIVEALPNVGRRVDAYARIHAETDSEEDNEEESE